MSETTAATRSNIIKSWIYVAQDLYIKNDFQSLKAIISAFGTPPICRLKKTWADVSKKASKILKSLQESVSETNNYENYRSYVQSIIAQPKTTFIPYLGVVIRDITYLKAVIKKESSINDLS